MQHYVADTQRMQEISTKCLVAIFIQEEKMNYSEIDTTFERPKAGYKIIE